MNTRTKRYLPPQPTTSTPTINGTDIIGTGIYIVSSSFFVCGPTKKGFMDLAAA